VAPAPYLLAQPGQLLADADGSVLVAERGGLDRVLRIDPATGGFSVFADGIPEAFGLARASDDALLVSSTSGIYRVPAGGGAARRAYETPASPIAVAANGDVFYAHDTSVGRIRASGGTETYQVDVSVPHGLALLPGGDLAVSDSGHGRILRIDPETGRSVVVATGLRAPLGLALDPAGGVLVAEYDAGRLVRVDDTGAARAVANGLRKPYAVSVGADGTTYVVEAGELDRPSGALRRVGRDGSVSTIRLVRR
jgi:sugar lactone lactonase YvrE